MEVYIKQKDWDKIINYARSSEEQWGTEIGGMAVTRQDKDGDWQILDPVILKQEVSAALCVLDKTELALYYSKAAMKYSKDNIRFCWWHSHAKMDAFWSGTDTNTIDEFEDGDLSFALVVNVKEEYKCRVSVWKPFAMHEDVELTIQGKDDSYNVPKSITNEVKALCKEPEKTWYNSGSSYKGITNKYGYTRHLGQTGLFKNDPTEENIITMAWLQLIEKVDKVNSGFIAGEYNYKKYANKIKDINRRLKKAEMPLSVELLEECGFEELLIISPNELINCVPGYESLNPSPEDDTELDFYNQSFNMGGI
tara:strand:+ start:689 stop:1615 length:927 start_codon:yes stop_codon:yes gene_type:complete